jgi:hypothetical protein
MPSTEPKVLNKRKAGEPDDAVYVGRPTKWGNPFYRDVRWDAIAKYEEWIRSQPWLMAAAKRELRGKNLVCWCAPKPCHADVLLRIANE